ncbi:hypothetical protein BJ912DRAFT_976975 [Pholiota molesta]|nr:hypothetical protein BJ912DRAFT_976975 [Pholiota molesta]
MTLPSSSQWNVAELELKAALPPSVASDPGLSAEVRQIENQNYFVFPATRNALGCRHCADIQKATECLVRVEGYLKFLRWIVGDMSETLRPRNSACMKCAKEHQPFCRLKCVDTILGQEWSTRDIGSKPPIDPTLGRLDSPKKDPPKKGRKKNDGSAAEGSTPPMDPTLGPLKRRRKKNDGSAAASSSKRPRRASPAKSVRIIRAAPADSPPTELRPGTQPTPSHAAGSASLDVTSESNDLLLMIVNEFDLNHLLGDQIDIQKCPG